MMIDTDMENFGLRLRGERKRLGLSQAEMAGLGELKANAQMDYEKGARAPSADYLMALMAAGVDLTYLFYGSQIEKLASEQGNRILNVLTSLPPEQEAMAFAIVNMFRLHTVADASADAELIWRAARLFGNFLAMPEKERTLVELAVRITDNSGNA
jgi:transcriptional regulator with XRE-family HTH domain